MEEINNNLEININDINELLKELEVQTSLIRKKPSEIANNPNEEMRKKEQFNYGVLEKIYILPLSTMANRISMKLNNRPFTLKNENDLSITGKMMLYRNYLLSVGCTIENITQLIPKNESEINLLFAAYKRGFSLDFDSNQSIINDDRLNRASNYLTQNINNDVRKYR